MVKHKYNKKEKNMFFAGAIVGIVGGTLGSFMVAFLFKIGDSYLYTIAFITFVLLYLGFMFLLYKQTKK